MSVGRVATSRDEGIRGVGWAFGPVPDADTGATRTLTAVERTGDEDNCTVAAGIATAAAGTRVCAELDQKKVFGWVGTGGTADSVLTGAAGVSTAGVGMADTGAADVGADWVCPTDC